jgi:hypothetical protein
MELSHLLATRYEHPLTKAVFGSYEDFRDMVQREINILTSTLNGRKPTLGVVEFEPWGGEQLSPGPFHDLDQIISQVLRKGSQIHDLSHLQWNGTIHWTKRAIKGWYGKAYWDDNNPRGSGEIRINCLLDSSDVAVSTVEFLVWHQYLHLFLQSGHTNLFRKLERKWQGYRLAERELDTLSERFEVSFFW